MWDDVKYVTLRGPEICGAIDAAHSSLPSCVLHVAGAPIPTR